MADVKISDAVPVEELDPTDMIPLARVGHVAPYRASMQDFAVYVTRLASSAPPEMSAVAATPGTADQYARADHVHPSDGTRAPLDSPELCGHACAPTPPLHDNSDLIATTEFVMREIADTTADIIDSPVLIGTPRAPTPGIDDNTDLIATTEYVQNQGGTGQPAMNGAVIPGVSRRWSREDHVHPTDATRAATGAIPNPASTPPVMDGAASAGAGTTWARADHVHPSDTSRAPLLSPPLTGTPTSTTPPNADASTRIATTAYVRTGTTTADNAPTGQIGEYLTAQVAQGSAIPISANVTLNIAQLTLSAGDWGVSGNVGFDCVTASSLSCGIHTVSAQLPVGGTPINSITFGGNVTVPKANMPIPATRISLSAPGIIYLVAQSNAAGTTYGFMNARRIR